MLEVGARPPNGSASPPQQEILDPQLPVMRDSSSLPISWCISGGASSGKSTFIKQLRLHKGDGFPEPERRKLSIHVFENLADALNILLDNMKLLGIDFDHEQHKVNLSACLSASLSVCQTDNV